MSKCTRALAGFIGATLLVAGAAVSACSGSKDGGASPQGDASVTDGAAADGGAEATVVSVQVLAFNDFHGNLRPPDPTNSAVLVKAGDPSINDAGTPVPAFGGNFVVHAGGASYLAAHLAALRAKNPSTLVVSAGDLTGASQLVSAIYDDEPTIDVMNAMGLDVNGVGNHEFDHGLTTLLHYQMGGCDSSDHQDAGQGSCKVPPLPFPGAKFEYLAANVDHTGGTSTVFPSYVIKSVGGAKIGFIGLTLSDLSPYDADGIVGLTFKNELSTANAVAKTLSAQGVDAIIVLLHEGGTQNGTYNDCVSPSAEITAIAKGIDPVVTAIHTAHTHAAYNCTIGGRPVTSAASFGRLITDFTLSIDTTNHKVLSVSADNVVVTRDVAPDPTVDALVNGYVAAIAPLGDEQVGAIAADLMDTVGPNGETPIGDVLADSMVAYAATQGHPSDVAFLNIGGIRDSIFYAPLYGEAPGDVTYEKAFNVIPFGDELEVLTCKGSDIAQAIAQNGFPNQVLQVSNGFTYSWSKGVPDPTSIMINGTPIVQAQTYQVVVDSFLAQGGDAYSAFSNCTGATPIGVDIDAFAAYLTANEVPALVPPPANRITQN